MMTVLRNRRLAVPINTGTIFTPARMAIIPAPLLGVTCPGFFTRVPSGKISRFQSSRRLEMAVFTAPISLLPRSTGNTPIFRRNQRTSGMENSCFFAMIRRLKLWGMASTSRMGSHALE